MELSRFDVTFRDAIKELNQISGRAFVLENFLKQTKERIEKDNRVGHELMTTGLPFRDITITLAPEKPNLFMPSDYYKLHRLNLSEETDMILSRECLFYISQAYEILEAYLYDQVSEFILISNTFHLFIDGKQNISTFHSIRKALKALDGRQNNRHLLKILRANSKKYAIHETDNIYGVDFSEWFEMLGQVRHCVTHKRMMLDEDIINALPKCYLFDFEARLYDGNKVLYLSYPKCSALLSRIAEYMFFVYKSVVETSFDSHVSFNSIAPMFSEQLT